MLNKTIVDKFPKKPPPTIKIAEEISVVMPQLIRQMHPFIFRDIKIPQAQMHTLVTLEELGQCSLNSVSNALLVSPPTASGLVSRLVESGYVKRVQDKDDRRGVKITLTKKGLDMVKRFRKNVKEKWYDILKDFTPHDQLGPLLFAKQALENLKERTMKSKLLKTVIILTTIVLGFQICAFAQSPDKKLNLSLENVTKMSLDNNFDIQIAKYDSLIAATDKDVSESIYDTILTAEAKYRNNKNAQTSSVLGTKTRDDDYSVGLSKKLPTGTTLGLDLSNNRNWTNASSASQVEIFSSSIDFSIDQDLGKNFLGIQDRGSVAISLINIEKSKYTSLEKIETSIASVQTAYWDLVFHIEKMKIQQEMVSQAKALHDIHQEKLKDGLVEIPEAIASEANYRRRKNEYDLAKNTVDRKENILKLMLNIDDNELKIEPVDKMQLAINDYTFEKELVSAFENRRDYKKEKKEIESKGINFDMKKNNLWPQINLVASLNRNGIGGHIQESAENIFENDDPDISVGLKVTVPFGNKEAKAELKAAELEKAKAIVSLKLLERKIVIGIADQVRDCDVYFKVAQGDKEIAELQSQKLAEEFKRFNYGRSDTDTLIRFQEDLIQAKNQELQSRNQYVTSLISLELKKGTLLNKYFKEEE